MTSWSFTIKHKNTHRPQYVCSTILGFMRILVHLLTINQHLGKFREISSYYIQCTQFYIEVMRSKQSHA